MIGKLIWSAAGVCALALGGGVYCASSPGDATPPAACCECCPDCCCCPVCAEDCGLCCCGFCCPADCCKETATEAPPAEKAATPGCCDAAKSCCPDATK